MTKQRLEEIREIVALYVMEAPDDLLAVAAAELLAEVDDCWQHIRNMDECLADEQRTARREIERTREECADTLRHAADRL